MCMKMEFCFSRKHVLWALINLICLSGYESCLEEERLGLLSIRDYFGSSGVRTELAFPSWTDNLASDCCSWERVKCNSTTGRVIELFLNNTGLEPEGSSHLERIWFLNVSLFLPFEELHNLDLNQNWFSDCYQNHGFERISILKKLEVLDLSRNNFQNNILPALSGITSLKTLNLSDNDFGGSFLVQGLEKISSLKKLKVLDLSYNAFQNNILQHVGEITCLKTLNLRWNSLDGSFPSKELKVIKYLETLDLSFNFLTNPPKVQDFKSWKNLIVLNLESNEFNSSILPFLSTLTSLKTLNLAGNYLGASVSISATELASLENLEQLDLSYNGLKNLEGIANGLSRFQKLEVLNLDGNSIEKSSLKSLSVLTSLQNLGLSSCNLDGVFLAQDLVSLKNLKILDLAGNCLTTLADLASLKNLEILDLSSNDLSGSLTILSGLCSLKNLQELDLSHNNLSGIVPSCLGKLTSLALLDLSSNKLEGDISSFPIATLRSLKYIDLRNNAFWGQFSFYSIANHSNLKVLLLSSDNHKLLVQTHYPNDWLPTFQLKLIEMSDCCLNNIPHFFTHQIDLRAIDLSHNNLTGTFPIWLFENNTQLEFLSLRNNSFMGSFHLSSNFSFIIKYIDISNNHFHGKLQQHIGSIIPTIEAFNLSTNAFDGNIPFSIGSLQYLSLLDLSDNKFFGEIPDTLLANSSNLEMLVLSNNQLSGQVPKTKSNKTLVSSLYLSGNQFNGTLSNWIFHYPRLSIMDISENCISGEIPNFIGNMSLLQLNMAANKLKGTVPCELFMSGLSTLDISYNNLLGTLPSCLKWSSQLKYLNLEGNGFTGTIPETFFNSSNMMMLNIGRNFFSGEIPTSIGDLSYLRVLQLRGNNLRGLLPKELCRLNELGILDLSHNSFSGPIPSCFSHMSFGKLSKGTSHFAQVFGDQYISFKMSYNFQSILTYTEFVFKDSYSVFEQQAQVDLVTKAMFNVYKGWHLELMSGLDLSCNQLIGEMPRELGNLSSILALNLSHNQLIGSIPRSWKNFGQIESLDLSYNKLSGEIPFELLSLHFLEVFSVAYNNFSGRLLDMKGQFATFDNKSYEGNPFLCGPPLETSCSAEVSKLLPSFDASNEKWHDIIDPLFFFASFIPTYLVSLLSFVAILYINPYWRRRWFLFIENFIDDSCFIVFYTIPKLFCKSN